MALELLLVAGGAGLILYFTSRWRGGGLFAWLTPALLLYAPVIALLATDRDFAGAGLRAPAGRNARSDLAGFVLVVLPLFLLGYYLLGRVFLGLTFQPRMPGGLFGLCLWQLLGVALPEEVFFRGWMQGRLDRLFGLRFRALSARVGPGLFIAAAAFAVAHLLVGPRPSRLLVFFPGLLFGYYRERSGSVAVPAAAHALGNVAFLILQSWAAPG